MWAWTMLSLQCLYATLRASHYAWSGETLQYLIYFSVFFSQKQNYKEAYSDWFSPSETLCHHAASSSPSRLKSKVLRPSLLLRSRHISLMLFREMRLISAVLPHEGFDQRCASTRRCSSGARADYYFAVLPCAPAPDLNGVDYIRIPLSSPLYTIKAIYII